MLAHKMYLWECSRVVSSPERLPITPTVAEGSILSPLAVVAPKPCVDAHSSVN
jgi:hypothetical protein